jgi:Tol biopolymer transport system component
MKRKAACTLSSILVHLATCDLEGKKETPFGNGRKSYGFPSPAPDGKRLLMMKFRADGGPEPVVIDLTTGEEGAVPHSGGLWAQPAWR